MLRFSAAMTLFGMQQVQNAVGAAVDTQDALNKLTKALNAMSDAVSNQMDASKQETLKSMSKVQEDLVTRTFDAMNVQAFDPREMMNTTGDLMRKTSDSLVDMVKKTVPQTSSSEPKSASEALAS
jgi:hypothetical protein